MHHRAVACALCGKSFFPASLPFHQKACAAKMASLEVPCQYCDRGYRHAELPQHERRCRSRPRGGQKPSPTEAEQGPPSPRRTGEGGGVGGLRPCAVCGRTFASERLAVHQRICRARAKAKTRRREVFDSRDARAQHIAEQSGGSGFGPPRRAAGRRRRGGAGKAAPAQQQRDQRRPAATAQSSWRSQSGALRQAMRQAKMVGECERSGGELSALPQPEPAAHPDFVPCKACGRTFAPAAHERHESICKALRTARPAGLGRFRDGPSGSSPSARTRRPPRLPPPATRRWVPLEPSTFGDRWGRGAAAGGSGSSGGGKIKPTNETSPDNPMLSRS